MKVDEIAKILANRVNQEAYILHYMKKIYHLAYKKGLEDAFNQKAEHKSVCTCQIKHKPFEIHFNECRICDKKLKNQS